MLQPRPAHVPHRGLQPSWLATRVEVVIYALLSRMLAGLALGAVEAMFLCVLVFVVKYRNYSTMVSGVSAVVEAALLLGLLFGLAAGVADACRLLMRKAPDDAGRSEPWWTTGIFVAVYWTIFGALLHLIGIGLSRAPFGLVWALLFALRGRRQSLYLDVQPVFGLTWSLRRAVTGAVAGTLIGLVLSALSLIVEGETINILGLLTLSSVYTLIGASFGGITRVLGAGASRTSGIRLTIRAALRGALLTGVIAGGVLGLLLLGILLVASLVQPESWQAVARVITQAGFRATPLLVVVWCAVAVLVIAVPVGIYFAGLRRALVWRARRRPARHPSSHASRARRHPVETAALSRLRNAADLSPAGRRRLPLCPRIAHGAHRRPWRWGHELGRDSERRRAGARSAASALGLPLVEVLGAISSA